jgi:3D (Asp-Asp-Asp) domain-containing protein
MNKKIKKKAVMILLVIVLTFSTFFTQIKLDFHRHKTKPHKQKTARIKPIDTVQQRKDIMRLKLFTRQQWLKKRKLEARKAEEKRERIKEEHQIKLNKEREERKKKEQQEKPYIERWITVTAYTNNGGSGHGRTASGAMTQEGVTIAAPDWVEMGSVVEINNHRYTVQDRGGKIQGDRFDLYIVDEQRAIEFGVKRIKAKIYKN